MRVRHRPLCNRGDPPYWKTIGGFDHGKTNPTAFLLARIDTEGTIYLVSEYANTCSDLTSIWLIFERFGDLKGQARIFADPSIFYRSQAQSDGGFKAIADIYWEAGLKQLMEAPVSVEIAGMQPMVEH